MTHTELRFTDRGPAIIEVNVRLGGDLIPYLGKLATGLGQTGNRVGGKRCVRLIDELAPRRVFGVDDGYALFLGVHLSGRGDSKGVFRPVRHSSHVPTICTTDWIGEKLRTVAISSISASTSELRNSDER